MIISGEGKEIVIKELLEFKRCSKCQAPETDFSHQKDGWNLSLEVAVVMAVRDSMMSLVIVITLVLALVVAW